MDLIENKKFEELIKHLKTKKSIIAVILFGSYAKGNFNEKSDIDICIITDKFISNADFDYPLKDEGYDIHFLHSLPLEIKFKVFSEGKILFVNDEEKYNSIRKKTIREYRGFQSKKDKYTKMLLERYS